ncbi:hypothetical protein L210DRAFT_3553920 [Boletus edulis BED1]|uniref:Uncharacterized protein n=1 Tax=Boletus edulis BED1 TaxID=1328754 RepID=A0AAD4BLH0_BOLED|nr:hypothetical protein L210DRAFT_3553920 [Boletus edulis BED1]
MKSRIPKRVVVSWFQVAIPLYWHLRLIKKKGIPIGLQVDSEYIEHTWYLICVCFPIYYFYKWKT